MKSLSATVVVLGLISFLTDLSSHMIFPLLPVFLTQALGAGAVALGLIEGLAESTAAFVKLMSGHWADRTKRRKPFLLVGYGLAGLARPLIGLATVWPVVLGLRFTDRLGKGVRAAPRDAMIADATPRDRLGTAYGYHRAMDYAGKVAGPLVASLLLTGIGLSLRGVFLAAFVPAALVMLLIIFVLREPPRIVESTPDEPSPVDPLPVDPLPVDPNSDPSSAVEPPTPSQTDAPRLLRRLPKPLSRFLPALAVFTFGRVSDAFLLLALHGAGFSAWSVALLWSGHNLLKTGTALLAGVWTDRFGPRRLIVWGWASQAAVYLGFVIWDSPAALLAVFLGYGLIKALAQPAEKTFIADLAAANQRGTVFGWYHFTVGLTALPAGTLFGFVWDRFGQIWAFGAASALITLSLVLLMVLRPAESRQSEPA